MESYFYKTETNKFNNCIFYNWFMGCGSKKYVRGKYIFFRN